MMKFLWIICGVLLPFICANAERSLDEVSGRAWIEADMNEYMDLVMNDVGPWLVENDMDPMNIPDMMEEFEYSPLLITYHGQLYLTNGVVSNLKNIHRNGNSVMSYDKQMLRVSTGVAMESLDLYYDYDAYVMDLGPNGWIEGKIENIVIRSDFIMDFYDFYIFIQDFRVESIGYIDIKVRGNILIDWMTNVVIKIVTTLFRGPITDYVSDKMYELAQATIDDINRGGHKFKDLEEVEEYLKKRLGVA